MRPEELRFTRLIGGTSYCQIFEGEIIDKDVTVGEKQEVDEVVVETTCRFEFPMKFNSPQYWRVYSSLGISLVLFYHHYIAASGHQAMCNLSD